MYFRFDIEYFPYKPKFLSLHKKHLIYLKNTLILIYTTNPANKRLEI